MIPKSTVVSITLFVVLWLSSSVEGLTKGGGKGGSTGGGKVRVGRSLRLRSAGTGLHRSLGGRRGLRRAASGSGYQAQHQGQQPGQQNKELSYQLQDEIRTLKEKVKANPNSVEVPQLNKRIEELSGKLKQQKSLQKNK